MRKKSKNKNQKIIFWSVVSVLIIIFIMFLLYSFGVLEGRFRFLAIGSEVISGRNTVSYTCPSGASFCQVKGTIVCNVRKDSEPRVIARADDADYSSGWLAYLNEDFGTLESWVYDVSVSRSPFSGEILNLPYGKKGIIHRSDVARDDGLFIFKGTTNDGNYYRYKSRGGADVTPTPLYGCQNQEICEGEIAGYSCTGLFTIDDASGVLRVSEGLEYRSSTSSGSDETGWFTIYEKEKALISGGDETYIDWQVIQEYETCVKSKCEGEQGYRECTNQRPGDFIPCNTIVGEVCIDTDKGAVCAPPLSNLDITFRNANLAEKSFFSSDEAFHVYVDIRSDDISYGDLDLEIREGSPEGDIALSGSKDGVSFTSGNPTIFTFNNGIEFTGEYYAVLYISYPGLDIPIVYGDDEGEKESFKISTPIKAQFKPPYQILGGIPISLRAYTGYPLYIEYIIEEPNGKPTLPDSFDVSATLNGVAINIGNPDIEEGLLKYSFVVVNTGEIVVKGTATRVGFTTPMDTERITIEKDNIDVEFINLVKGVQVGNSYTINFETRNKNKILVPTTNIVKVQIGGEYDDISNLISGSNGKYSFSYTFLEKGDYQFTVESSDPLGDLLGESASTPLINSVEDIPEECTSDVDCGFWKACDGGRCKTKITLILLIVGSLAVIVLIIIMIYKFVTREREPSILGGY